MDNSCPTQPIVNKTNNFFKTILLPALIGLLAFGCATTPQIEITEATCGPRPENYQELIKEVILSGLKDPESARFKFGPLEMGAYCAGGWHAPTIACWHVKTWVNAKNSYGGYVGDEPYWFSLKDGKVLGFTRPWERPRTQWGMP
jgi:hypothetical protein